MCACPARLEWRARALAVVSALGDGARLGSRLNGGRWDRTTQWGALAEVSPGRRRTAPSFDHALQNPPQHHASRGFPPRELRCNDPLIAISVHWVGLFCAYHSGSRCVVVARSACIYETWSLATVRSGRLPDFARHGISVVMHGPVGCHRIAFGGRIAQESVSGLEGMVKRFVVAGPSFAGVGVAPPTPLGRRASSGTASTRHSRRPDEAPWRLPRPPDDSGAGPRPRGGLAIRAASWGAWAMAKHACGWGSQVVWDPKW